MGADVPREGEELSPCSGPWSHRAPTLVLERLISHIICVNLQPSFVLCLDGHCSVSSLAHATHSEA